MDTTQLRFDISTRKVEGSIPGWLVLLRKNFLKENSLKYEPTLHGQKKIKKRKKLAFFEQKLKVKSSSTNLNIFSRMNVLRKFTKYFSFLQNNFLILSF